MDYNISIIIRVDASPKLIEALTVFSMLMLKLLLAN